jgi:TRAP-type C4-dicarboxylate transport system permease small subunit
MQFYLTYLAAQQLLLIVPGTACIFFCITVCLGMVPVSSRQWIADTCFTYVMSSIALFTLQVPFWGMLFILVMTHYLDYIVHESSQ